MYFYRCMNLRTYLYKRGGNFNGTGKYCHIYFTFLADLQKMRIEALQRKIKSDNICD